MPVPKPMRSRRAPYDVAGRWALITGGSSGLGEAVAHELARRGANLILVAHDPSKLAAAADLVRRTYPDVDVTTHALDLADRDARSRLLETLGQGPQVDIVVNNAGVDWTGPFVTQTQTHLSELVNLNVGAVAQFSKHYAREMAERGEGVILNMTSLGGLFPLPYHAAYGGSKAYILSMTEALAYELHGTGVNITAAAPGPVRTQLFERGGMRPIRWRERLYYRDRGWVVCRVVEAALDGRRLIVPGLFERFLAFGGRLIPRFLQTWIAREIVRGVPITPAK